MPERTPKAQAKLDRLLGALRHQEGDRVPISDFYWGSFLRRWREELGLAADADPYTYYDLDYIVLVPNLDPHIRRFEVLEKDEEHVVVRTGFECVIRKQFADPMPAYLRWDTQTVEQIEAFQFDDPWDARRYFFRGDDQLNGIGDSYAWDIPSFVERVKARVDDIPVFGSVCEGYETLWRIVGSRNALELMALEPDAIARFVDRISEFSYQAGKAQILAADGMLSGMYVWGDVAYRRGMLFSPTDWRQVFKPVVQRLCELFHSYGLPVIYHGCGNATAIYDDLIEAGIDGYNPLEAKAGLDVVELRRELGHRLCLVGNLDVTRWAHNDRDEVREAVLRKLNAAKGGGFIPQSDHSVPSNVSGEIYDHVVDLVRTHGRYPLQLGAYDIPDLD